MGKINQLRIKIWLNELSRLTCEKRISVLGSLLDPKSIWRDEEGVPHQSKWYSFQHFKTVPSKSLDILVKQQLPEMVFELHHPAWSLMNRPRASKRTIYRYAEKMPTSWKNSLEQIKHCEFDFRSIDVELLTSLNMYSLSFLDAFMLFEVARRFFVNKDSYKSNNLTYVLLALPLLYVDDPVWIYLDYSSRKHLLALIDRSMDITSTNLKFPAAERLQAMDIQWNLFLANGIRKSKSQKTPQMRRLFFASCLSRKIDVTYKIATRAYCCENHVDQFFRQVFDNDKSEHYTEKAWRLAWEKLRSEPKYSRLFKIQKR